MEVIYVNKYSQYIYIHNQENIFSTISNLQTNLFWAVFQKNEHAGGKWSIYGIECYKDN